MGDEEDDDEEDGDYNPFEKDTKSNSKTLSDRNAAAAANDISSGEDIGEGRDEVVANPPNTLENNDISNMLLS